MQKAEEELDTIIKKFLNSDIDREKIHKLDVIKNFGGNKSAIKNFKINLTLLITLIAFIIGRELILSTNTSCLLEMPPDASKVFREPENCAICQNVQKVAKVANVTTKDFYYLYAKKSKPIIISDGAHSWPALEHFNYNFFKELYSTVEINNGKRRTCQFFPYNTEFKSLEEVFHMNRARASLKKGEKPWYVGWSNCNDEAGQILQKYYKKPYFLSNHSENIALSWIFMGGPGHGAHMHVDNVHYPSWQAQLSGRKKWRIAPPPECYYKCQEMEVTVEPGEIIVLDTNRWYHQTFVLPGEISITIGSEFD